MHLAEQVAEVDEVLEHLGRRPTEWLLANSCGRRAVVPDPLPRSMDEAETTALARGPVPCRLCPITESSLGDGHLQRNDLLGAGGAIGVRIKIPTIHIGRCSNEYLKTLGILATPDASARGPPLRRPTAPPAACSTMPPRRAARRPVAATMAGSRSGRSRTSSGWTTTTKGFCTLPWDATLAPDPSAAVWKPASLMSVKRRASRRGLRVRHFGARG